MMNENEARYPGNTIHPTAVIGATVMMGTGNYIGPYCVIGMPGEHREKWGIDMGVVIGSNNIITKHVIIDSGIEGYTHIGDKVFIMAHAHVGHDASVFNNVTISCGVKIGGHAAVWDNATIGLNAVIHQRSVIPKWCMIGMGAVVPLKSELIAGHTYVGNPVELLGRNKKAPAEVGDECYKDHFMPNGPNTHSEFCKPLSETQNEQP